MSERVFMGLRVRTDHIYPPIPCRQFDWVAYVDPESHTGHGPTEQAAIEDLIDQIKESAD